jgi:hypothetical protein
MKMTDKLSPEAKRAFDEEMKKYQPKKGQVPAGMCFLVPIKGLKEGYRYALSYEQIEEMRERFVTTGELAVPVANEIDIYRYPDLPEKLRKL